MNEQETDNSHVDASTSHHVYIRSKDDAWIPGRLIRVTDETATVEVKRGLSNTTQFRAKHLSHETIVVQLKDYPNRALPLQNVSRTGELMVVADMVDLPFLHEVCAFLRSFEWTLFFSFVLVLARMLLVLTTHTTCFLSPHSLPFSLI